MQIYLSSKSVFIAADKETVTFDLQFFALTLTMPDSLTRPS